MVTKSMVHLIYSWIEMLFFLGGGGAGVIGSRHLGSIVLHSSKLQSVTHLVSHSPTTSPMHEIYPHHLPFMYLLSTNARSQRKSHHFLLLNPSWVMLTIQCSLVSAFFFSLFFCLIRPFLIIMMMMKVTCFTNNHNSQTTPPTLCIRCYCIKSDSARVRGKGEQIRKYDHGKTKRNDDMAVTRKRCPWWLSF